MPATESLTIEIQGDSSGLSQALDDALAKVESLQSAADGASSAAAGIGTKFAAISSAMQPLQQIGQQLTRLSQQAKTLGQQPITLNVQPALSALQMLLSAIQAVAAQLRALSMPGVGPIRGPGGGGGTGGGSGGAGGSAGGSGGYSPRSSSPQSSSGGTDSASGDFVARSHPLLSDWGQSPIEPTRWGGPSGADQSTPLDSRRLSSDQSLFNASTSSLDRSTSQDHSSSTVNHFGGITIEVRETADVNSLMRDLRLQGLSTRHRQG